MPTVASNTRFRPVVSSIGALAAAALPLVSNAGALHLQAVAGAVPAVVVRYDDLNLQTEAGVHVLYGRIVAGARLICGQPDNRDLPAMALARSCRLDAVAHAVQAADNPRLAAVYAARRGQG